MSRLLLAGLALQTLAVIAFTAMIPIDGAPGRLGPVLIAGFTAVPALGGALAAWGVRRRGRTAVARASSVFLGAAAVMLGLAAAGFAAHDRDLAPGALGFGVLFAWVGWTLVPWIAGGRLAAAVIGVGVAALLVGVPLVSITVAVDHAFGGIGDRAALAAAIRIAAAAVVLAALLLAGLRRQLGPALAVPDSGRRLARLARIADGCALGVVTLPVAMALAQQPAGSPVAGPAAAAFFLAVAWRARRAVRARAMAAALPTAISRPAAP
jgi:hypothetical protein